ncbi:catalase [Athelia psychrophila]|uniref:Catalase n=1 Tax=Athelia psychrophila TaxID=1759441 RepID=A0A166QLJ3_9AGAM|nr:catalase [Fibularhizoctonia sp. CBS 109695]
MPFPDDETIMKTAGGIVEGFQTVFGKHPGFRPAHAKGFVLNGTFTPTPEAASLSIAHHFNAPSTPIVIRFSNSTGIPAIPDTDPNADPRGIAIRFNYPNDANGRRVHTDLIMHSVPFFPTRTGAEFLEFLHAIAASSQETAHPNSVEKFVGSHPATLAFVQAPKPVPTSFARQQYFSVTAFTLINSTGKENFVRYHVTPEVGVETLTPEEAAAKGPNFLHEEMTARLKGGPAKFKLSAQIADESDVTDDATVHWPESRKVVELGTIVIEAEDPDSDATAKNLIFDPIPRVPGVGPSADPLLEMRAAIYLMSGKQRRAA